MNLGETHNGKVSGLLCVCTVLLLVAVLQVHAADIMNDQRLFFSDKQRQLLDVSTVDASNSHAKDETMVKLSSTQKNQPKNQTDQSAKNNALLVPKKESVAVHFNGLVTGRELIQVLINGKPCLPVNKVELQNGESSKPIKCPHLNSLPFGLSLHIDSEQIIVRSGSLTKAQLGRGDKF